MRTCVGVGTSALSNGFIEVLKRQGILVAERGGIITRSLIHKTIRFGIVFGIGLQCSLIRKVTQSSTVVVSFPDVYRNWVGVISE